MNLLLNVTIYDISVIYVTAHICAGGLKKKLYLRSGSQRHRHFVGFFNVPVQAPTRGHPFYTVIPRNRPILAPFTITLRIRRTHSRLNPRALTGALYSRKKRCLLLKQYTISSTPSEVFLSCDYLGTRAPITVILADSDLRL